MLHSLLPGSQRLPRAGKVAIVTSKEAAVSAAQVAPGNPPLAQWRPTRLGAYLRVMNGSEAEYFHGPVVTNIALGFVMFSPLIGMVAAFVGAWWCNQLN